MKTDKYDRSNQIVQRICLAVFSVTALIAIIERIPIVIQLLPIVGIVCLIVSVIIYLYNMNQKEKEINNNETEERKE